MTTPLQGTSLIGFSRGEKAKSLGPAVNAATGETFGIEYFGASADEVEKAARLAEQAFPIYSALSGKERAAFLRRIDYAA